MMERNELLLRRLQAQHLLTPGEDCAAVAGGLCGLQAQFLRNAVHALRIRTDALDVTEMVKTWTLRGTVHLVPEKDLPLYLRHPGTAEDVCVSPWYVWIRSRNFFNPPERERVLARMMADAVAAGIDTREQLRTYMRQQGMTEPEEARCFDGWGGLIRELAEVGVLAFRVDMLDDAHPDETKRYRLLAPVPVMDEESARLEIARRYLTHYGPVTLRDAAYFLHWTQAEAKAVFVCVGAEPVKCEDRTYWHIPDCEPLVDKLPEVILLAGFDPLMMGYRKEDNPFLPPKHLRGIFNLAGIVNPAILLRGRVVGKWKERAGKAELTAFESLSARDRAVVEEEVSRLFSPRTIKWT